MALCRRIAALLFGLALALAPIASYAQSPDPTPPSAAFPRWEDMPDVVGYVSIEVPQCSSPHGNQLGIQRMQPVVSWTDMGSVLAWLSWQIENTAVGMVCWGFAGIQQLANGMAITANAFILGVNVTCRALLLGLLDIQGLALWTWYGFELLRGQWWNTEDFFNAVQSFLTWVQQAFWAVLTFVGQFIGMVGNIVAAVIGMLGWVVGFLGEIIGEAIQATTWTTTGQQLATPATPAPLSATSTIYCGLRGILDGIHDSKFGFAMYLFYALAYVGFVYWASRFFSGERSAS
jgi:hypothetical protein